MLTGKSAKIDSFIDLMKPLGLVEIARTGAAAMGRGKKGL
jgi:acetolactate synthase-1/3 small subunit